jgi:platelet-activating factor acetylhydrolase IB subunit alpha
MASLALTERQRNELNTAIYEYLVAQGDKFLSSSQIFKTEANLGEVEVGKGMLEKKWTSIIRLQKRVMELEAKVEQLQQQRVFSSDAEASGESNSTISTLSSNENNRLLPKPPAKISLSGHRASVTVVVTHPIYSLIASGSEDTTIRIWDHETNQYERTLKGHTGAITGLAFDARGLLLASCSADMSAKLWDMNTFNCTKTLKGHDHTISCIKFTPSGDQVITGSRDQTIKFWEVNTGYCVKTLTAHSEWVKAISISLDGHHLASCGVDQSIIIWQISTGSVVQVSYKKLFFISK